MSGVFGVFELGLGWVGESAQPETTEGNSVNSRHQMLVFRK